MFTPSHFHFELEYNNQKKRKEKYNYGKVTIQRVVRGSMPLSPPDPQEDGWRSWWVKREEMGYHPRDNWPWTWLKLDLALTRICPTWQWYESKFHEFEEHGSCQKTWLHFWTELFSLLPDWTKEKIARYVESLNCLALNTIGPFLPDTQGKQADVRAAEVTFNALCVPRRHIRAKERWLLSPLWDKQ